MTTLLAPEIDDRCNDDNCDRHVKHAKQYPISEDGTVVYRLSAGPWGRIEHRQDGTWVLFRFVSKWTLQYGIGKDPRSAVLNYIDRNHECDPCGPRVWCTDAATPQQLYARARVRTDQIVNILNSVGGQPKTDDEDFKACPPEIMEAVLGLVPELIEGWEKNAYGSDLFWINEIRNRIKHRYARLQERWACKPLPRF